MTNTASAEDFSTQWHSWHAAREAELAADFGWLTPVALFWLNEGGSSLTELPGTFFATSDGAGVRAVADDGWTELATGRVVDGQLSAPIAEGGSLSWLERDGLRVELLRRGGRVGLRLRDNHSPVKAAFTGVPAFELDPGWVLEGTYTLWPAPEAITVETAQADLRQQVSAIGTLDLSVDGADHTLILTGSPDRPALAFHDPTNATTTAAWRLVAVEFGDQGRATVDFNRAVNFPYTFTTSGTCPAPVAGNTISVPVTAGEQRPNGSTT